MQRHALAILAPLFLLAGLAMTLSSIENPMWGASAIRIGAFFAALWLAYPHLGRLPRSAWVAVLVVGIVVARWRYLLPLVVVILVATALLRRFAR